MGLDGNTIFKDFVEKTCSPIQRGIEKGLKKLFWKKEKKGEKKR